MSEKYKNQNDGFNELEDEDLDCEFEDLEEDMEEQYDEQIQSQISGLFKEFSPLIDKLKNLKG